MISRLVGSLSTLVRRLLKVFVAAIVALVAGGSLSSAFGLIDAKAFVLTGAIFMILITAFSRTLPRSYKLAVALPIFLYTLATLTAFPGLARLEDAAASELDRKAHQIAYSLEAPKETDCADPFLDPRTGEPVKFFLVRDGKVQCFDRPGVMEGEDLRPATKEAAYLITHRQEVPALPAPVVEPAPTPTPPAEIRMARNVLPEAVPVEPTPVVDPAPMPTPMPPGAIPCDRDARTRAICDRMMR
ncbi:MAG TPA: hypothetical protein VJ553_06955 [Candidatus Paceibacterota bacterium]|nr:hypothetical protein [Candidatus Paceibacterota bacterium]